jgi:hypothetical protein
VDFHQFNSFHHSFGPIVISDPCVFGFVRYLKIKEIISFFPSSFAFVGPLVNLSSENSTRLPLLEYWILVF